ncbi:MAG: DedA family protein, partial [Candidatus Woesearchaeota archaeon]|nr:DedA family protein [Candidatus Woesearchaeota archaeon]
MAIFFAILASTIAIPIPEDIVLLIAGYLAASHVLNIWTVLVVAIFAVVIGDNIGYWIGRQGGGFLLEKYLHTNIKKWVRKHYKKHGPKTVFFSRFLTGIRNLFHITAGASGMRWKTFFAYDLLGALIAVPLVVFIGFVFGKYLPHITRVITAIDTILIYGVIIMLLILAILACIFREQAKNFMLTKILHKNI